MYGTAAPPRLRAAQKAGASGESGELVGGAYARTALVGVAAVCGVVVAAYAVILYSHHAGRACRSVRGVLRCCAVAALAVATAAYNAAESGHLCLPPETSWFGAAPATGDALALACCVLLTGTTVDALLLWESVKFTGLRVVTALAAAAAGTFVLSEAASDAAFVFAFVLMRSAAHVLVSSALLLVYMLDFRYSPQHAWLRELEENARIERCKAARAARASQLPRVFLAKHLGW